MAGDIRGEGFEEALITDLPDCLQKSGKESEKFLTGAFCAHYFDLVCVLVGFGLKLLNGILIHKNIHVNGVSYPRLNCGSLSLSKIILFIATIGHSLLLFFFDY